MPAMSQTMTILHLSAAVAALSQVIAEAMKVGDRPAVTLIGQASQQLRASLRHLEDVADEPGEAEDGPEPVEFRFPRA